MFESVSKVSSVGGIRERFSEVYIHNILHPFIFLQPFSYTIKQGAIVLAKHINRSIFRLREKIRPGYRKTVRIRHTKYFKTTY